MIIGDMDSISESEREQAGSTRLVSYPADKDETDLELALLHAKERGAEQIVVIGAMGGRMDMSISNILLLAHPTLDHCHIEVWHGDQTGWLIRPPGDDIAGHPGDTVSLIPLNRDVSGITTKGLKHVLSNGKLTFGPGRGLSNVIEVPPAKIRLARGLLFAVHTPGRA